MMEEHGRIQSQCDKPENILKKNLPGRNNEHYALPPYKTSRFSFLSDTSAPMELCKLECEAIHRHTKFLCHVNELDRRLAALTAKLTSETLDREAVTSDLADRFLFNLVEDAVERVLGKLDDKLGRMYGIPNDSTETVNESALSQLYQKNLDEETTEILCKGKQNDLREEYSFYRDTDYTKTGYYCDISTNNKVKNKGMVEVMCHNRVVNELRDEISVVIPADSTVNGNYDNISELDEDTKARECEGTYIKLQGKTCVVTPDHYTKTQNVDDTHSWSDEEEQEINCIRREKDSRGEINGFSPNCANTQNIGGISDLDAENKEIWLKQWVFNGKENNPQIGQIFRRSFDCTNLDYADDKSLHDVTKNDEEANEWVTNNKFKELQEKGRKELLNITVKNRALLDMERNVYDSRLKLFQHLYVYSFDARRQHLDSLKSLVGKHIYMAVQLEISKANKRTGRVVRKIEFAVGLAYKNYCKQNAARLRDIEIFKEKVNGKKYFNKNTEEWFLEKIGKIRIGLESVRTKRVQENERVLEKILKRTLKLQRAVVASVSNP